MKIRKYIEEKAKKDPEFKQLYSEYDLRFEVAELITEARIYKNLTQAQLAELVGTKQSSISRVENGSVLPNLSFLERIASAVGTYLIAPKFGFMNSATLRNNTNFETRKTQVSTFGYQPLASPYFDQINLRQQNN